MKPEERFLLQPRSFWAMVRTISQELGYTVRGTKQVRVPIQDDVTRALSKLGLYPSTIEDQHGSLTTLGEKLLDYFDYRAWLLNEKVEPLLMNAEQAKAEYERLYAALSPNCPIPNNKQKGEKKAPAYLTSIVIC